MKGKTAIVLAISAFLCGPLYADSVEWISGLGATAPSGWSISPSNPSATNVISFSGPTDKSYGNSCTAEVAFGGAPYLSVNNSTKTIELKFQGPAPTTCTMILKPAVGFRGEFGPLAAGNWTFKCTKSAIAFQLSFTVGGGVVVHGDILRVDRNAPLVIWTPDGSSWTRAYRNLQDALAAAESGDTIHVADGLYTPDDGADVTAGDRTASFVIPDGVTVLCGFAGYGASNPDTRDPHAYPTILSGDLNDDDLWGILNISDNSYHVVSALGSGTLAGATVTAGNADGSGNDRYGGGVLLISSTLRIEGCKIRDNKADFGAGVACLEGVAPTLIHTEITGNWAYVFGGGLYNDDANVNMTNCLVVGNTAGSSDILGGDAIFNVMGSLDITNCTIADNRPGHADANGKAVASIIWGPGFVDTVSIKNSIVRNGGTEIWSTEPGIVTLYYNNIEGGASGFAGTGNLDADPLFKNPGGFSIEGQWVFDENGYTLRAGSPSLNKGSQALLPVGLSVDLNGNTRVQGGQVDQGAYEGSGLPPAVVLVPDVLGQTLSSAQTELNGAGLVVGTTTYAYSSTVANGRVISQDPASGSVAVTGSAVNLTISQGPAPGSSWVLKKTSDITLTLASPVPSYPITVNGSSSWTFTASGTTEWKIEAESAAGLGGSWTITPSSGTVTSGTHTISFAIHGEGINVSSLSPGERTIAQVKFYTR
jgi:hypothetical protein